MTAQITNRRRNIADYAVALVAALGSETVFSLAGGMAMHLNRAVAEHPALRVIFCQHEQACVAAAEGYAKAADFRKAGLAVITAGPGVSNSITSLLSANMDSTPLIVLAGQIKTDDIDRYGTRCHGIQEIPSQALVSPCVKRFARLTAEDFRETLVDTITEAFVGRPGVVFIEIPLDVQGVPVTYTDDDITRPALEIRNRIDAQKDTGRDALADALKQLLAAKRPLLHIGNGCRIAGVESAVTDFARRHRIPAMFTWLSLDMMPADDPIYFGCPGGLAPISSNEILCRADVIVFLGTRMDLGTTAFQRKSFGAQATRYFVDIDAQELAKFSGYTNTFPVAANLSSIADAIPEVSDATSAADGEWLQWCQRRQKKYLAEEREKLGSKKMTAYNIAQIINRWADEKVFVPASSGYAEESFTRFFRPGNGTRFFNGAALGSMGLGLPHAIGASFGSHRRVVCLEADGGIMLNLQELATLKHYAPKGFVILLLNNRGYESIRASQTHHFGMLTGVDADSGLYIPDFAGLCAGFGIRYQMVETPLDLEYLLPRLRADDGPVLVDLRIERAEDRGPSVKTIIGDDGKPSTTALAEISW